jgi:hypothetical protein
MARLPACLPPGEFLLYLRLLYFLADKQAIDACACLLARAVGFHTHQSACDSALGRPRAGPTRACLRASARALELLAAGGARGLHEGLVGSRPATEALRTWASRCAKWSSAIAAAPSSTRTGPLLYYMLGGVLKLSRSVKARDFSSGSRRSQFGDSVAGGPRQCLPALLALCMRAREIFSQQQMLHRPYVVVHGHVTGQRRSCVTRGGGREN